MGSGGGSQVVYYVPTTGQGGAGGTGGSGGDASATTEAKKVTSPAIAKSISGDSAKAIEAQAQERKMGRGVGETYNRYKYRGVQSGNTTLGGS